MSAAPRAALALHGAAFGYGGRAIVRDLDLQLESGRLIGLMGANGAGKTTLLRGLLGLLPPLRGQRVQHLQRLRYVPQRESLDAIWPLRVSDVVASGTYDELRWWGGVPAAARERAREALRSVGLDAERRQPFAALSGGQRQRVLIARALAGAPEVLFLDEPTSGVDEQSTAIIMQLLTELATDRSLCVVLVSHQRENLEASAHQLWELRDGSLHVYASRTRLAEPVS